MGSDLEEQLRAARLMVERFDASLRVKEGENALLRREVEALKIGLKAAQDQCQVLYEDAAFNARRAGALGVANARVAWLEGEVERLKDGGGV